MSNKVELKPCPFCGGEAYFANWGNNERIYIDVEHKMDCGNMINGWFNASRPIEEQVERWNNRYMPEKRKIKLWKNL